MAELATRTVPTIVKGKMDSEISSPQMELRLRPEGATSSGRSVSWAWLAGLLAAATVLRIVALNQQLWFDEIVTLLDSARDPIWRIVTHYGGQNQHMLYSVLAHCSIRVFGEQPWTLRLPAVIFGAAGIPALYFFGCLVTTKREALFAALLMAINYQHIWFSQNARGYTGMVFWTLLASIFFIHCANNRRKTDCLIYGISAALGIYTHLMMAFVVVGHAILYAWLIWSRMKSTRRVPRDFLLPLYGLVLAGTLSFALYAPVIPGIFARTIGVAGTSVRSDWASPVWARSNSRPTRRSGGWSSRSDGRRPFASRRFGRFLAKQPLCRWINGPPRFGDRGGCVGNEPQLLATLFLLRNRVCSAPGSTGRRGFQ
jgi:Dolichyl-phosphate-mannose-protein mannosyltransferase